MGRGWRAGTASVKGWGLEGLWWKVQVQTGALVRGLFEGDDFS